MPIALATSVSIPAGPSGGTSAGINTTGATLIVACTAAYWGAGYASFSDSRGNTWIGLTSRNGATEVTSRLWYCSNPSVGSGHTFTTGGGSFYMSGQVAVFTGTDISTPFDKQTTAAGLSPGSATPANSGALVVTALASNNAVTYSVNGGFTITTQTSYGGGSHEGSALAYLIQTSIAAANPTWTSTGETASTLAIFNAAASAASSPARRGGARLNNLLSM